MFLAPQDALHVSTKGASYLGGSGGMFLQGIFKTEHSETLFPSFLEREYSPGPKNQFLRQGWSSLKFSLKSKIFSEIGQLIGERGGVGNGSKFMGCLSKKKMIIKKNLKNPQKLASKYWT